MNQSHLSPWLSSRVGGCRTPSHKCALACLGSGVFSVVVMSNSHSLHFIIIFFILLSPLKGVLMNVFI